MSKATTTVHPRIGKVRWVVATRGRRTMGAEPAAYRPARHDGSTDQPNDEADNDLRVRPSFHSPKTKPTRLTGFARPS